MKRSTFLQAAVGEERVLAIEISQLMDGLPLALDQAGAYIKEMPCSLSDYITRYRIRSVELLKERGSFDTDYPESVATTWSLSFEKVSQADPAAAELLNLSAFLYPEAIPEEILTEGAPELGPTLKSVAANMLHLERAFREVLRFSLLHREADAQTFSIHRLVQSVLKTNMDMQSQLQWAERAVRSVNRIFPKTEFSTWSRCQRYILQAQACSELINQHNFEFVEAARLLNQAGIYLAERGQFTEARPLTQQAVAISVKAWQSTHTSEAVLNYLISAIDLAELYVIDGQHRYAEQHYKQILAFCQTLYGQEHFTIAECLGRLAALYHHLGRDDEAEQLYKRALIMSKKLFGPRHVFTAQSYMRLAGFYHDQLTLGRAETLYIRALRIYEKELGAKHPRTIEVNSALGKLMADSPFNEKGQIDKEGQKLGKSVLEEALKAAEDVYGPEHPRTAVVLSKLALFYRDQGQYKRARQLFRQILMIYQKTFGPEHPRIADTLHYLGELYQHEYKYKQADRLYREALMIYEKTLGWVHPHTFQLLRTYADLQEKMFRYGKARKLKKRIEAIADKLFQYEEDEDEEDEDEDLDEDEDFEDLEEEDEDFEEEDEEDEDEDEEDEDEDLDEDEEDEDFKDLEEEEEEDEDLEEEDEDFEDLEEEDEEDEDLEEEDEDFEEEDEKEEDEDFKDLEEEDEEEEEDEDNYIGIKHLLPELIHTVKGVFGKVLSNMGMELSKVLNAGKGKRLKQQEPSFYTEKSKNPQQFKENSSLVEMKVESVRINQATDERIVILQGVLDQRQHLFIWVNHDQAYTIATKLYGMEESVPFDLFSNILNRPETSITMVIVSDVTEGVYNTGVKITSADKEEVFDVEVADGIALALHCAAPIFVEKHVLDEAGVTVEDTEETENEEPGVLDAQTEHKSAILDDTQMPIPFDMFTEQARKALSLAQEEVRNFQHNYIGTEHLLLGLVCESEGVAAKILGDLGVKLSKVRSAVEFIIGRGGSVVLGEVELTPRAKRVIELAAREVSKVN